MEILSCNNGVYVLEIHHSSEYCQHPERWCLKCKSSSSANDHRMVTGTALPSTICLSIGIHTILSPATLTIKNTTIVWLALAHLWLCARPERSAVEQSKLALKSHFQLRSSADHISSGSRSMLRQSRFQSVEQAHLIIHDSTDKWCERHVIRVFYYDGDVVPVGNH